MLACSCSKLLAPPPPSVRIGTRHRGRGRCSSLTRSRSCRSRPRRATPRSKRPTAGCRCSTTRTRTRTRAPPTTLPTSSPRRTRRSWTRPRAPTTKVRPPGRPTGLHRQCGPARVVLLQGQEHRAAHPAPPALWRHRGARAPGHPLPHQARQVSGGSSVWGGKESNNPRMAKAVSFF